MAPTGCQTMGHNKRDQISPFCKCGDQAADRHDHSSDETGGSWGPAQQPVAGREGSLGKGKSGSSSVGPGERCHGRKVVWSEKAWARSSLAGWITGTERREADEAGFCWLEGLLRPGPEMELMDDEDC